MPGLKTGVENDIVWSEIGPGFGEQGGTPPPRIPPRVPPGFYQKVKVKEMHKPRSKI